MYHIIMFMSCQFRSSNTVTKGGANLTIILATLIVIAVIAHELVLCSIWCLFLIFILQFRFRFASLSLFRLYDYY